MKLHVPLLLLAALLSSANAASDVENVYIVNQTEAVLTARIDISRAEGIVAITDNDSFVAFDFTTRNKRIRILFELALLHRIVYLAGR